MKWCVSYNVFFLALFLSGIMLKSNDLCAGKIYAENSVIIGSDQRTISLLGCGFLGLSPCREPTVKNKDNATADNGLYSRLYASPGLVGELGSYEGVLELRFDDVLPANITTYIRIDGEKSLLQSLLGGSLGDLLSGVLGSLLFGEQELIIDARTSSESVLSRSSEEGFDTDRVRLVTDASGGFFVAIKPSSSYDRIRITNKASSVAGLNAEYMLDVYHAFYFQPDPCDYQPVFTSFDGQGLTLDVASLNSQVMALNLAIDDDLEHTFSQISLGVVGLGGTMEQMIYLNTPVQPGNEILISMATGESLLDLGLLNYVELVAYSNGSEVKSVSASSLLELDVLGLLAADEFFKFPISADSPIDRVGVRLSSLVGLGVLEGSLNISGVSVAPVRPGIESIPEEGVYVICYGEIVTVTPANEAGRDLNWYRLESGTEQPIGTADTYVTPNDLDVGEHEFLVRSQELSCTGESEPSRFKVRVRPKPAPENIEIQPQGNIGIDEDGKYTYIEGINPVTLEPELSVWAGEGEFKWYLDETMAIQLQDGDVIGEVLYELENGKITMTGLEYRDESDPYRFYLNYEPDVGCPMESPMEVDLSSIARILHASLIKFNGENWGNGQFKLNWEFAGVSANEVIKLERSGTDLQFEELAVFSMGESNGEGTFIDIDPLPGYNYYRLQIVDEYGKTKFTSHLKRLDLPYFGENYFQIYPNYFESEINISKKKSGEIQALVVLYSGDGSVLKVMDFKFKESAGKFRISDLDALPSGNYVLQVHADDVSESHHLIKR